MQFEHISIKGIVSAVPTRTEKNLEYSGLEVTERTKLSNAVGIFERRVADKDTHTSDLCVQAAGELFGKINWDPNTIDVLIFVSQTPDYVIPSTSHIIQSKLGLKKNILCFDINEGCAGYVYGLSILGKLLNGSDLKRGLLLVGDTVSKFIAPGDHSNTMLFGDCGTATAVEFNTGTTFTSHFDLYSDGAGKDAIIIEKGSITSRGFKLEEGICKQSFLSLKGSEVFLFAIKEAPKAIETFITQYSINPDSIDAYCLHQANKIINDAIAKKLKINNNRFLQSLEKFGNTSSASIPLSICNSTNSNTVDRNILICGFGVGLSWGVGFFLFEGNNYSIIEV